MAEASCTETRCARRPPAAPPSSTQQIDAHARQALPLTVAAATRMLDGDEGPDRGRCRDHGGPRRRDPGRRCPPRDRRAIRLLVVGERPRRSQRDVRRRSADDVLESTSVHVAARTATTTIICCRRPPEPPHASHQARAMTTTIASTPQTAFPRLLPDVPRRCSPQVAPPPCPLRGRQHPAGGAAAMAVPVRAPAAANCWPPRGSAVRIREQRATALNVQHCDTCVYHVEAQSLQPRCWQCQIRSTSTRPGPCARTTSQQFDN